MSLVDNRLLVGTDGQGLKIYNSVKGQLEDYTINSAPMNFFGFGKIHTILEDKDDKPMAGIISERG